MFQNVNLFLGENFSYLSSPAVTDTTVVTADTTFCVSRVMLALSLPNMKTVLEGRDEEDLTVIIPDYTRAEIVFEIEYFIIRGKVDLFHSLLTYYCRKIQYYMVHYSTIWYKMVQYSIIQYNRVQYNTIQYSTVKYVAIQYSTIEYGT